MSPDHDPASSDRPPSPGRHEALDALTSLAEGLVYSSEGEHPFSVVHLGNEALDTTPSVERLRTVLKLPDSTTMRLTSVSRVLARHTELTHPDDGRAQALRPRYERLQHYLEHRLRDPIALRVGEPPAIAIWLLGRTAEGELVGYRTVAIET
ncbi:MAG: nuclease A inhibitor family protein [Gemmatimonadota bacterium]